MSDRGARPETERIPRRVHLLGAGGAGVSGAARILVARGHVVSGHDRGESSLLESLRELGIELEVGPSAHAHLPADAELVARSAAVPDDDPLVREARARGLPVLKYAQLLARLAPPERTAAVAGTHGKTTTAWMLWHALDGLGEVTGEALPGAVVGGVCRRLGVNALPGGPGSWFAVEACEYDRSFLCLSPRGAAITNVEADHLDYYGDLATVEAAFADFAARVHPQGRLVLGSEVPAGVEAAARAPVWRLGRELSVELVGEARGRFRFRLKGPGFETPEVELAVPGRFNVENAALALALAVALAGAEERAGELAAAAARGVEGFRGVFRRFEPWGTLGGIEVVHDYAHHPTEVRATLEAARRAFPGRALCVLFQPHQHSRTARFLGEFVESLRSADQVCVADVYGARVHIDGARSAGAPELAAGLARAGVAAGAPGGLREAVRAFAEGLPERAAALVIGAGDIETIKEELFRELALRSAETGRSRS